MFFQFREACRGIADACRAFGTPVTGGNVSFYNESPTGAIDPTPPIGMVGLLERAEHRVPSSLPVARATSPHPGCHPRRARRLGLLGGDPRLRRRRCPEGGPRRRAAAAATSWWRPRPRACSGRPTTARKAACWSRWPRRRSAGPTRRARLAPSSTSKAMPPASGSKGCSSGKTPAGSCVIGWIRRTATPLAELARRARRAGLPGGPRRARPRRWNCGAGSGVFTLGYGALRKTYFEAIPRRMQHADAERSVGE